MLLQDDRVSVKKWYNSFVDFAASKNVPIRYTQDLHINLSTNPDSLLDPALYQFYSSAIYAELEEDGALSATIMAYQGLLKQFSLRQDRCKVLKEIMRPFAFIHPKLPATRYVRQHPSDVRPP